MDWLKINNETDIDNLKSAQGFSLIFKHSYSCSISGAYFERFKRYLSKPTNGILGKMDMYLVDVIKERPISLKLAEVFRVEHQSPQVLLIHDGKVVYNISHNGIDGEELKEAYELILSKES